MKIRLVILLFVVSLVISATMATARAIPNPPDETHLVSPSDHRIVYRNIQYRFCFLLPASWEGYSILTDQWKVYEPGPHQGESGPVILIRHPKWTEKEPYADIPIMVFTLAQWHLVDDGEIILSAAPIGPSELGRNAEYVFAAPARYSMVAEDFQDGKEVIDLISHNNSLHAPCGRQTARTRN